MQPGILIRPRTLLGTSRRAKLCCSEKGHSPSDIKEIESVQGDWTANGKIAIEIDNADKKQTKLIFRISPEEKHAMRELETAIGKAVAGTSMKAAGIEISWLK